MEEGAEEAGGGTASMAAAADAAGVLAAVAARLGVLDAVAARLGVVVQAQGGWSMHMDRNHLNWGLIGRPAPPIDENT